MAQWTNLQWIERFVNPTRLYITCEKSGGPHLPDWVLQKAGRPADKIWARLEILKACCKSKYSQFSALFSQSTALFQQLLCISSAFSGKHFHNVVL